MDDSENHRDEARLTAGIPVFVEMPEQSEEEGDRYAEPLLLCRLVDFSANGARIALDRPLPVGAILRLSVRLPEQRMPLTVVGEVRWVSCEEGRYLVGFSLYEADQTDILQWKSLLARRL